MVVRGMACKMLSSRAFASSTEPENAIGAIECSLSSAGDWVETQFGLSGQGANFPLAGVNEDFADVPQLVVRIHQSPQMPKMKRTATILSKVINMIVPFVFEQL